MNFVKRDKKVLNAEEIEMVFINESGKPYLLSLNFETIKRKLEVFFRGDRRWN